MPRRCARFWVPDRCDANFFLLLLPLVAHAHHRGEGEKVVELQGQQTRVALGRKEGKDQKVCAGVHQQGPAQAR